ncbi:uncharacterized protein V2V93DRAFT_370813 [Kockiozyma suomiensis]|uniref:uncharacterized protein n=1 Tax=Kockiozyma suomiensis TaxID=1337062 RepID=UPI0033432726
MSDVDISIRSYSTNPTPKPHTVYHIQVRLPLRSYTLMKRYSEFVTLAYQLENSVNDDLPFKLPKKHLFNNSVTNLDIVEERRDGLEKFLRDIQRSSDSRWRLTDTWREFMGLGGKAGEGASGSSSLLSSQSSNPSLIMSSGQNVGDPIVWLDTLHEVKSLLHVARKYLSDRDTTSSATDSRTAAAEAKKCLVQTGTKIVMLDRGLKELSNSVGQGELRRRTDMLNLVRKEREGLESLAATVSRNQSAAPSTPSSDSATGEDAAALDAARAALFTGSKGVVGAVTTSARRVLGPLVETAETRQQDNRGLLDLQMQKMRDQEESLEEFSKILARQRQLGVEINDELELQTEMIRMLEDDVDNSDGKLRRADRALRKVK